jgi:hypothetical protein
MARKFLAVLLFVILVFGLAGCNKPEAVPPQNEPPVDEEIIQFTASEMFSGETVHFPGDYQGKVVYLFFYFYG